MPQTGSQAINHAHGLPALFWSGGVYSGTILMLTLTVSRQTVHVVWITVARRHFSGKPVYRQVDARLLDFRVLRDQ